MMPIDVGPILTVIFMTYIIVRRGEHQLYDRLYRALGSIAPVVWDQRGRLRSPQDGAVETEAPREERRRTPPVSWVALGFVVVDRPLV